MIYVKKFIEMFCYFVVLDADGLTAHQRQQLADEYMRLEGPCSCTGETSRS